MVEPLRTWLAQTEIEPVTFCDDPRREAEINYGSFSMSEKVVKRISVIELTRFLTAVVHIKQRQLSKLGARMLLYFWFDEMAGRICYSLVSSLDFSLLPFRRDFIRCDSLDTIVARFLRSPYLSGIPWSELSEVSEPIESVNHKPTAIQNPLEVYAIAIPPMD